MVVEYLALSPHLKFSLGPFCVEFACSHIQVRLPGDTKLNVNVCFSLWVYPTSRLYASWDRLPHDPEKDK